MSSGHYLLLNLDAYRGVVKSGELDECKKTGCRALAEGARNRR